MTRLTMSGARNGQTDVTEQTPACRSSLFGLFGLLKSPVIAVSPMLTTGCGFVRFVRPETETGPYLWALRITPRQRALAPQGASA